MVTGCCKSHICRIRLNRIFVKYEKFWTLSIYYSQCHRIVNKVLAELCLYMDYEVNHTL